jgi:glycosyltransferase involved in cell wall biosynthesis
MGLQVLLLTRYGRKGASSRLRFLQYLPGLDDYGIDVHPAPFLDDTYLKQLYHGQRPSMRRVLAFYSERLHRLAKARDFDVVWIEKEVLPWVPGWVARAMLRGTPLVIDFDDAWHLRYSQSSNPLIRLMLGQKLERLAKYADFVIVANKFLQRWAEDAGAKRVTCIPTVVDLRRYPQTALPPAEPFTIGWIGTPETAPYLEIVKPALKRVLAKEGTRLLLVGAEPSFLPLPNVETQSWSEAREADLLQRMHVGIMPLPQGVWEYGKSGYKLVQYMAASRPVVASPVGVNNDVVKEGVNGFFAITEEEWIGNLERFRGSPSLIERCGAAARATVENAFSLRATLPKIAEILKSAAALRPNRHAAARAEFTPDLARSVDSSGGGPSR